MAQELNILNKIIDTVSSVISQAKNQQYGMKTSKNLMWSVEVIPIINVPHVMSSAVMENFFFSKPYNLFQMIHVSARDYINITFLFRQS
jgi:hypothetical protein